MQKMTRQTIKMVEAVNAICKDQHIKDEADPLFSSMCWLLSQANCYHGFNFFTEDGRLAGSLENADHVEIYIR